MCVQHYRQYEDRVNNSEQCVQYNGAVAKALEFDNTHYDWTRRQEQGGWVSSAGSWISIAGREVASTDACVIQQAVGGRPPRYAPAPILPPWAPKCLARPSRWQHSSSFSRPTRSHAHRCSCLTHQYGGE